MEAGPQPGQVDHHHFLTVKEITGEDGQPNLLISMDREKINTVGQEAISKFLLKLQVYKSPGDKKNLTEKSRNTQI